MASGVIFFELRIRRASLKTLIGAAGSILGIIGSTLIGFLITAQHWDQPIKSFLTLTLTLFMAYVGLLVGAAKGDYLDLSALGGILSERGTKQSYKILDTSVIIDGRVADIAEAGFMGGTISSRNSSCANCSRSPTRPIPPSATGAGVAWTSFSASRKTATSTCRFTKPISQTCARST